MMQPWKHNMESLVSKSLNRLMWDVILQQWILLSTRAVFSYKYQKGQSIKFVVVKTSNFPNPNNCDVVDKQWEINNYFLSVRTTSPCSSSRVLRRLRTGLATTAVPLVSRWPMADGSMSSRLLAFTMTSTPWRDREIHRHWCYYCRLIILSVYSY